MFSIQSIILTPSPYENMIKEMTCYLYPGVFLFGYDIIIEKILILLEFMQYSHY